MSYSGSQQQYGLSDLQLLQQQVMLARLQELQKQQQQLGQLGDVKSASSLNNLSLFAKQAASGQISNLGHGTPFNASNMFASSDVDWMNHNVSSSMQGISRGSTYSHDGLMINPALQLADISLYGTTVRGNMGQHTPLQGVSHSSVGMLSVNSDQKPIMQVSPFANSFMGSKHSVSLGHGHSLDGSFILRQGLQEKDSVGQVSAEMIFSGMSEQNFLQNKCLQKNESPQDYNRMHRRSGETGPVQEQTKQVNDGTATLDPLEEKILFDTEDSTWDTSFSKLAAIGTGEFVNTSGRNVYSNAFSSVQSGSWSALMQSAVAEASSSDTGIQEELSGLSFQNTDSPTGKQPSNLVTNEQQHVRWTDSNLQSSSYNLRGPPSSGDSMVSSESHHFQQTGFLLTCQQGVNKNSSEVSIEQQPKHASQWSESQQQLNQTVPFGHLGSNWVGHEDKNSKGNPQVQNSFHRSPWANDVTEGSCKSVDVSQGSRLSGFPMSGMAKNDYRSSQQGINNGLYMPITDDTDQRDYNNMSYYHHPLSSRPLSDTPNKRAAEMYGNLNRYRGENSSDSYNSKLSEGYIAQLDHACLHAEDSESSARSGHKSQNQALCMTSPGAKSQQECFSRLKSTDAFPTNTDSVIKGKSNLSADGFSKHSPASDMSTCFDSKYTAELNKANQPKDHRSAMQFGSTVNQSEFQELDVANISVSQAAAIPDRFSFQSSVQGDSRHFSLGSGQKSQNWWTPSSFGHSFPPSLGVSQTQNGSGKCVSGKTVIETLNMNCERNSHGAMFSGPPYVKNQVEGKSISNMSAASESVYKAFLEIGTYHQGVKPLSAWMNMPSQRDVISDSCKVSSNLRSSHTLSDPSHVPPSASQLVPDQSSLVDLPFKTPVPSKETVDLLKDHESAENHLMLTDDASKWATSSMNQQGYIKTGLTDRSSTETTLRALQNYSQPQQSHTYILDNIKHQIVSSTSANIVETDMTKGDGYSSAISYQNKQQIPEVAGKQQLNEANMWISNPISSQFNVASQFNSSPSGNTNIVAFSSGTSSSLMGTASSRSALQYIYSHKAPIFGQGRSDSNNRVSDRITNPQVKGPTAPAWYMQSEYIKNGQTLSLSDSSALSSVKPSMQLSGTRTLLSENDASRSCGILPSLANQVVTDEQSLPSSMLPPDGNNASLVLSRKKKRKTAMYDCHSWHEEVTRTCQELPDISIAEQEWAEVTNRLIEKSVDAVETNQEMLPAVRAKRRLILTTQLLQQVFGPPPPTVLSADAGTEYEIVVYSVAKLALGEACSLANNTSNDCKMRNANVKMVTARDGTARTTGHLFGEAAKELLQKTKKLESHLERLDRSLSVVDVQVECKELEKFSVINHFAKYHSRVIQPPTTDSASSSTAVASVRPFLQRYVSAVPLPQKLPEGVQCLSL